MKYQGYQNENPENLSFFKYLNLRHLLTLPEEKQGIKNIIKTNIEIGIIDTRVLSTIEQVSLDGIIQTNFRVSISGQLQQTIEYIPDSANDAISIAFYKQPFNSFITLPINFSSDKHIYIQSYILDVFIEPINKRTIAEHIYILLNVDI